MNPGDVIDGRFEILRRAGSGGMGVVYEGRDRDAGRKVALKVLSEKGEGLGDRFAHEIELLAALDHPHIVGYVAHGMAPSGAPYLVMPWLDGFDLQVRVGKEPLSVDETLTLARAVAGALGALHGKGLVHRDLKPSNLFLPRGRVDLVKLIDLGIARSSIPTRALTISGVLVGTPGYIAPEQARGDREVQPAVDIFALGCVLFECLTGQRLFAGQHLMAVLAKVLLEDAPRVRELRADVPEELDRLIHRMVAKDPERRPRDGAELGRWLADVALGPATVVPPPPLAAPTSALTGTEQRVVSVVVVVLPKHAPDALGERDATRVDLDPFRSTSARFGVRVHLLAERTAIALAPEGISAADQAAVLARFGRYVAEALPGASVALATGTAVTAGRLPVGEAIDKGIAMVRGALPGEGVCIDDVSAALITSRFDIRRSDKRLVVEGERTSLDPTRLLLGRPTSCIGRDRELSLLDGTFGACVQGAGPKVVLLTAPSGAGKSRVAHEFVRRLRGADASPSARVLQARGDPLHQSTPYGLVGQSVRHAFDLREREDDVQRRDVLEAGVRGLLPGSDVVRITAFLGELAGVLFDDAGNLPLRAARQSALAMADQVRLAFEETLRALGRKTPIVMVLDDLHWADDASVRLLDAALRRLDGAPLLVIGLARPELHERFPGLFAKRDLTEIRLPPLPPRACARLVQEAMGEGAADDDVARLVARSEGNAFYLEELIRAAAESALRRSSPPPPLSGREGLPKTVLAVAQSRLERLQPRVRKVLRAASVFGDRFWIEGVATLVGETPAAVEPLIDALVEQEAVGPVEDARLPGVRELAFRHALLRSAAYETLTEDDRALGHRLAAEWLAAVGEDAEVVAIHWLDAGQRVRAAAQFADAAETRWARAQADASARCAARALLVWEPSRDDLSVVVGRVRRLAESLEACRRVDARDVIAGLERHVVQAPSAKTIAHAAIDGAVSVADLAGGGDAARVLSYAARALGAIADFDGALALLERARSAAGEDDAALRHTRYSLAKIAYGRGEVAEAGGILSGLVLPADSRDRLDVLLVLAAAAASLEGRPALPRALDFVARAAATAEDDPVAQAQCLRMRFLCHSCAGDHDRAAEVAQEGVDFARRGGLRFEECAHLHNLGESWLLLGRPEDARSPIVAARELAHDLGAARAMFPNDVLLAYIDGDDPLIARLAEEASAANDSWHELHARYWRGRLLVSRGAPEASGELHRAEVLARRLGVREIAEDCARLAGS
jgi:tetratricopeptide (TPR) repeat protein